MRKSFGLVSLFVPCIFAFAFAGSASVANASQQTEMYAGWLKMYDLKFDDAHTIFSAWKKRHPGDSLGPASNAAAYLFSELARLGALESELFVDDSRFRDRAKLRPDAGRKALFLQEIAAGRPAGRRGSAKIRRRFQRLIRQVYDPRPPRR